MACYRPIPASQNGPNVKLWPPIGESNISLPCGKCIGCRTDRATMWAHRATHEASQWQNNQFLTLTYDDEHLPPESHLDPRHLQLFIKRMRKYADSIHTTLGRDRGASIRYLACGEYGETNGRPHYHALIFNGAFTDTRKVGKNLYSSEQLQQLWPHGQHRIGELTPASASYVAQYNVKKQGAGNYIPETGEWRPAPFIRMSLKPAIGAEWLKKYATDLQHGYLVEGSRKHPIPRYYRDKIKEHYPELRNYIQEQIDKHRARITDKKDRQRLADTETIHTRRKQLTAQRQL